MRGTAFAILAMFDSLVGCGVFVFSDPRSACLVGSRTSVLWLDIGFRLDIRIWFCGCILGFGSLVASGV